MNRAKLKKSWQKWKGTPFARLQARPQGGVDCANLAAVMLTECGCDLSSLGLPTFGLTRSQSIRGGYREHIEASGLFEPVEKIAAGDVLIFRIGLTTEHIGIALDAHTLAHSWPGVGATETDLRQPRFADNIIGRYRYAGRAK